VIKEQPRLAGQDLQVGGSGFNNNGAVILRADEFYFDIEKTFQYRAPDVGLTSSWTYNEESHLSTFQQAAYTGAGFSRSGRWYVFTDSQEYMNRIWEGRPMGPVVTNGTVDAYQIMDEESLAWQQMSSGYSYIPLAYVVWRGRYTPIGGMDLLLDGQPAAYSFLGYIPVVFPYSPRSIFFTGVDSDVRGYNSTGNWQSWDPLLFQAQDGPRSFRCPSWVSSFS